jgi:hypothetical protein
MSTDLLQAFQIITELGVDTVGENLAVLAIDDIALTIEEPRWDLVLSWVLDDGDDALKLFGGEFTSTVDVSTLSSHQVISIHTACSGRHRPSCTPSWSIAFPHPLSL